MCVAGCPNCNLQSDHGPSMLNSTSIHNPPCLASTSASGVRSLNCAVQERPQHRSPKLPNGAFCVAVVIVVVRADSESIDEG
eukprot:10916320-Alexandrium_andersonii.AAC.1